MKRYETESGFPGFTQKPFEGFLAVVKDVNVFSDRIHMRSKRSCTNLFSAQDREIHIEQVEGAFFNWKRIHEGIVIDGRLCGDEAGDGVRAGHSPAGYLHCEIGSVQCNHVTGTHEWSYQIKTRKFPHEEFAMKQLIGKWYMSAAECRFWVPAE